ncbi:MAG: hypothetical protein U9N40_05245 [Euryarchaeota archaeon]|nr:hypothetical protein [Euryarchaeota archaeon]
MSAKNRRWITVPGVDENGLAEVVGLVLIIALIVIILSLYATYVVPDQGRDGEILHMNSIKDRFIEYKISLDSLWNNEKKGMFISTNFGLGTGGGNTATGSLIPILKPISSSGQLSVCSGEGAETMTINWTGTSSPLKFTMGDITFTSGNNYWIQQTYYYQDGGVFLKQGNGGTTIKASPRIYVDNIYPSDNYVNFSCTAIKIVGNQRIRGGGPVRLGSRLKENIYHYANDEIQNNVTITINASENRTADMWYRLFCESIENVPSSWYSISLNESENQAVLDVWGGDGAYMDLTYVEYATTIQSVVI